MIIELDKVYTKPPAETGDPEIVKAAEKILRKDFPGLYHVICQYKNLGTEDYLGAAYVKAQNRGLLNDHVECLINDFINIHRHDDYVPKKNTLSNLQYNAEVNKCKFYQRSRKGIEKQ